MMKPKTKKASSDSENIQSAYFVFDRSSFTSNELPRVASISVGLCCMYSFILITATQMIT